MQERCTTLVIELNKIKYVIYLTRVILHTINSIYQDNTIYVIAYLHKPLIILNIPYMLSVVICSRTAILAFLQDSRHMYSPWTCLYTFINHCHAPPRLWHFIVMIIWLCSCLHKSGYWTHFLMLALLCRNLLY